MDSSARAGIVADAYPGARTAVYLDNASTGITSTRVVQAMKTVLVRHMEEGVASGPYRASVIEATRGSIARLVAGRPDRVAFTQNTTTGLALVVNGVDWERGDNVVVPAMEFSSNLHPWLSLAERRVEVRLIPFHQGHARLDDILAAVDERTRVVTLSAVQYSSGYRYTLDQIADVCRQHGALFVVDGTQAVGALRLNVADTAADVLVVGAHKWLLGPFGIGFVHLSDRALNELTPSVVGWASAEDPFAFHHELELAHDARRFESGTWNAAGIAGLGASVDLALELGPEWIEHEVLRRADQIARACEEANLPVLRAPEPEHRSAIVVAGVPGNKAQDIHQVLAERHIRCSLRGDGIRFSPHYFTSDSDVDKLAGTLREVPGGTANATPTRPSD